MAKVFSEILLNGIRSGKVPAREKNAREWYRERAQEYGKLNKMARSNERKFLTEHKDRLVSRPINGSMYMFGYYAKHRETLPYWDAFPLVFPIKKIKGGFLGINMHYLPLPMRAELMDSLYTVTNNQNFDENTKVKISYNILNKASKFDMFKPCLKHYLTSQMQTRFLYIYPAEWDIALFLPLERFQKKSKTQVWAESKKIIRGN